MTGANSMGAVWASGRGKLSRSMASQRTSELAFLVISALLFVASATTTIVWCTSMSAMGEMPMPGGWTMSMVWMRMPGQAWSNVAAAFLPMWFVMTMAMMLPSLVTMLWRYRQAVSGTSGKRLGLLTCLLALVISLSGPFSDWSHCRWA